MMAATDRIVLHVMQAVVHPAHVPFVVKTQATIGRRARDAGPRCRFLGDHQCAGATRSEEHTSELQSLMRISYAVFCLKKKKNNKRSHNRYQNHNQPDDNTTREHKKQHASKSKSRTQ